MKQEHRFDTKVQGLKYYALREVARNAWNDTLLENLLKLPEVIIPGKKPTLRCCVYKERAIMSERVKLAMGGNKENKNVIEVINIACDECPIGGYEVTNACRGCLSHRCDRACKFDAIKFDENHVAHIDKNKCKSCGACSKVCPFMAIINRRRPCEIACKIDAITMDEEGTAVINNDSCIACGACVYMCPFGAISDKSFILDAIKLLKESNNNNSYKVYAVIAPSFSSQFSHVKTGQVISAIKELGFYEVIEAALGADMVADAESKELVEKGFLTSSCCPAFVKYIETNFPELKDFISSNLSPMATISKYIKEHNEKAKVVFIGPCTAKKAEVQKDEVKDYVDVAITFEELQALIDSKDIPMADLEESTLDNASYFGRIFARCGGLADAVAEGIKEHGDNFDLKAVSCDGISSCKIELIKKLKGMTDKNFIEGMACIGGCVGGAGVLKHDDRNRNEVDKYSEEASEKTIADALSILK